MLRRPLAPGKWRPGGGTSGSRHPAFASDLATLSRPQVQPGLAVPYTVGSHGVGVALAHDDVVLAEDLDLGLVRGIEQNPVPDLDGLPPGKG